MSSAGGPKERAVPSKRSCWQLWEGEVDAAIELLKGAMEWVRNPPALRS